MKYGRIILAAIASEVLAIVSLVVVVAIFGPSDAEAATAFAAETGIWFGPVAGFVFTFAAAWFVARNLESDHVQTGVAVGVATSAIDVLLLLLSGGGFRAVFVLSNVGRIVAGSLGGWLAGRKRIPDASSG